MARDRRQERKVVTVLFCDLVGFTTQAEEMDPEEVAALLGPYHARLKKELERYGGTVEKFIGDAVMALFGAPIAHEDDPERAVRAALAIRDFAAEEGLELRIGVTTGEALVNLDARPDAGETMATGDVVNTAARLQVAAPVNGILVGEKTHAATKHSVDYREAEPAGVKGNLAGPVPVWEAVSAGPLQERAHTTPLVGRELELGQLRDALVRAQEDRVPQHVTLVGEPGIGKSRLVHEVFQGNGDVAWRKGRCLPYGDGVAFWALGEIVKAQLGILESDSTTRAEEKLVATVEDPWVAGHLRTLVGIGEEGESLGDRRAEAFAAWRRFLTTLAEVRPLALVFEDVHWADEGLLDFVTHLVEWARESPLLVLCTARPELLERRPGWGATAISLSPLSDDETSRLLSAVAQVDASEDLLTRTAGNPLYVEQYARLLAEGGSLEQLPMNVQGIIAARLDGLPVDEKALLQDIAVIGGVFWSGAVAALVEDDRWTVEERLLALERRELVRRERSSSVEDETEYGIAHVLVRDVAYSEIPRTERAAKHRLAAEWIESLGRPDDHVELLAHHYLAALEYARASGADSADVSASARLALRKAGERALALSAFAAAVRYYRAALELWPADDDERPYLLLRYGTALRWAEATGEQELAEARDGLIAADDSGAAAEAEVVLADIAVNRGQRERAAGHLDRASSLVGKLGVSQSKAYVLGHLARFEMLDHHDEKAIELGLQALSLADELDLDELRPHILNTLGIARVRTSDSAGIDDLERSIELALGLNAVADVLRGYNNLAATLWELGEVRRQSSALRDGLQAAERYGERIPAGALRGQRPGVLYMLGEWDEALHFAEEFIVEVEGGQGSRNAESAFLTRSEIRLARDDVSGALTDAEHTRQLGAADEAATTLTLAWTLFQAGSYAEAEHVAEEYLAIAGRSSAFSNHYFYDAILLHRLGREKEARLVLERSSKTRWREAAALELRSELEQAADAYADIGHLPEEARMRMKAGEQLLAQGRRADAEEQLEKALGFWRSVGATRYIRQVEKLLTATE